MSDDVGGRDVLHQLGALPHFTSLETLITVWCSGLALGHGAGRRAPASRPWSAHARARRGIRRRRALSSGWSDQPSAWSTPARRGPRRGAAGGRARDPRGPCGPRCGRPDAATFFQVHRPAGVDQLLVLERLRDRSGRAGDDRPAAPRYRRWSMALSASVKLDALAVRASAGSALCAARPTISLMLGTSARAFTTSTAGLAQVVDIGLEAQPQARHRLRLAGSRQATMSSTTVCGRGIVDLAGGAHQRRVARARRR